MQGTQHPFLDSIRNNGMISATTADAISLQYIAPYSGVDMGEYFEDNSTHAVTIPTDLSEKAVAYGRMSLLPRRPWQTPSTYTRNCLRERPSPRNRRRPA